MAQDTQIVLPFARLCSKTLHVDFDGGTVTSDGGVLLLRETESRVGIIRRFVGVLDDPRDGRYTDHRYEEMLRQSASFRSPAAMTMPAIAPVCDTIRPSRRHVSACRSRARPSPVSPP